MNSQSRVLLIHPPVVRPCEPPPGIARLAGALAWHGVECEILDANIEGLEYLLNSPAPAMDTWTRRAVTGIQRNLNALREPGTYTRLDRYRQAVLDLNRVLTQKGKTADVEITLSNYQDAALSPLNSGHLLSAFESPEKNCFFPYFENRLRELITAKRPDLIGISVNFLPQALCAFAMIGALKRLDSKVRIMMGGGLVTSWMKRPEWQNPFSGIIDTLVCGPGEQALLAALGIVITDEYPLPCFDGFSLDAYLSPGRVMPYSASSGCYWRKCAFCPERAEKNPYRPIPPALVLTQLTFLADRYRPALIHLTDNAVSPALLKALAGAPRIAPWYGFVRITAALVDPEFCRRLKRSGCVMLQVGLESGSQRVLNAFGKGIDLTLAAKALDCLKAAGIATYVYLLFGTPWETEADAEKTLAFTVVHHRAISFLNLAVFNLPAYGPEADLLLTGDFYDGDLSLYRNFSHPSGWDRHRVRQFLDKKFKRHPNVADIVRRDPPVFTSNHAPFIQTVSSSHR
ncbi:MAG: radical SAM protein [Desulfobacterales bacterium]|jgi:hypothetical protein|nr:radical SAM protein [Desulfobacterales bacterium]